MNPLGFIPISGPNPKPSELNRGVCNVTIRLPKNFFNLKVKKNNLLLLSQLINISDGMYNVLY